MSSGSSHKMYDYEVAPPPGIWEKIEAELDESELSQKFPSALFNLRVNPPAHAWQKIAIELDEPAFVNDYAAKLGGIEIVPPVAAWDKIKTALDPQQAQRRISPFIKYAAAAAIIGFLAWGGFRLFNDSKKDTGIAAGNDTSPSPEHVSVPGNESVSVADGEIAAADMTAALEEARNDAALEASKKTYAKLDVSSKRTKVKNAADFFFVADDYNYSSPGTPRGFDPYIEPPIEETPPVNISNRYIVLMTPDGNIIRMSKKLRNLVCCVSGEDMDKDCVDQMKKWRDKMASPAATHTPGNFLDLLHMLNSMQDN
ncbi:MAG TPA: hypothetical protein VGO58_15655 [Chitinophagaceae bacterium]|jgi:hypothetical protein|nr:hypothetical protein [Chitinophagaceae bacterium]